MSMTLTGFMPFSRRRKTSIGTIVRNRVARAWRNFTTRRDFAAMDDRMLKDLGVSRAQAHFEANKPIWR
jgi:uncharacterized protein YjiS (DUF1127 family)